MFTLKKILNGRINVSEPVCMASGVTAETTFPSGAAVSYSGGKLVLAKGDVSAEYVVRDTTVCKAAEDTVPLTLVTKDMLFEAPLAAAPTGMLVGGKYTLGADAASVTATAAANGFGAYLVDKNGAAASGDTVIVRLA